MTQLETLLPQLGWPSAALDLQGELLFTPSIGKLSVCAALLIGSSDIKARIRSSLKGDHLTSNLELQWLVKGELAEFKTFSINGKNQDLEEQRAMKVWQHSVQKLGVEPKFKTFKPRQEPDLENNGLRI